MVINANITLVTYTEYFSLNRSWYWVLADTNLIPIKCSQYIHNFHFTAYSRESVRGIFTESVRGIFTAFWVRGIFTESSFACSSQHIHRKLICMHAVRGIFTESVRGKAHLHAKKECTVNMPRTCICAVRRIFTAYSPNIRGKYSRQGLFVRKGEVPLKI